MEGGGGGWGGSSYVFGHNGADFFLGIVLCLGVGIMK